MLCARTRQDIGVPIHHDVILTGILNDIALAHEDFAFFTIVPRNHFLLSAGWLFVMACYESLSLGEPFDPRALHPAGNRFKAFQTITNRMNGTTQPEVPWLCPFDIVFTSLVDLRGVGLQHVDQW